MKFRVYSMPISVTKPRGGINNNGGSGGSSHESEYDLGMLVSDFLENGKNNSSGNNSIYSSDSDSALADLPRLIEKISYIKMLTDQRESHLLSVVNSIMLSISERDLQAAKSGLCHASCIRFLLVKHLQLSGYDAGVCKSSWQRSVNGPRRWILQGDLCYILFSCLSLLFLYKRCFGQSWHLQNCSPFLADSPALSYS